MFLEKFSNKCVRIQYFVGNEKSEVVGHITSEDSNFICLQERSQVINVSSIASIYEEPDSAYPNEDANNFSSQDVSVDATQSSPYPQFSNFGNQQPVGFNNQQPMGFGNQQPMGFNNQQSMGFNNQQSVGFNNQQSVGFNNFRPVALNNQQIAGFNNFQNAATQQLPSNNFRSTPNVKPFTHNAIAMSQANKSMNSQLPRAGVVSGSATGFNPRPIFPPQGTVETPFNQVAPVQPMQGSNVPNHAATMQHPQSRSIHVSNPNMLDLSSLFTTTEQPVAQNVNGSHPGFQTNQPQTFTQVETIAQPEENSAQDTFTDPFAFSNNSQTMEQMGFASADPQPVATQASQEITPSNIVLKPVKAPPRLNKNNVEPVASTVSSNVETVNELPADSSIESSDVPAQPKKTVEPISAQPSARQGSVRIADQAPLVRTSNEKQVTNIDQSVGKKESVRKESTAEHDHNPVYRSSTPSNFTLIKASINIRKAEERKRREAEKRAKAEAERLAKEEQLQKEEARKHRTPSVVTLSTATPSMFTVKHHAKPAPQVQEEEVKRREPKTVSLRSQPPLDFTIRQKRLTELVQAASRALVNPLSETVTTPIEPAVDPMTSDSFLDQVNTSSADIVSYDNGMDQVTTSDLSTSRLGVNRKLTDANTKISVAMPVPDDFDPTPQTPKQFNKSTTIERLMGNSKTLISEAVDEAKKFIRFAPPTSFNFTTIPKDKDKDAYSSKV